MPSDQEFQDLKQTVEQLKEELKLFRDHQHLDVDGSKAFKGETFFQGKGLTLAGAITTGTRVLLPLVVTDGIDQEWLKPGAGQRQAAYGMAINGVKGSAAEQINNMVAVSKPGKAFSSDPTLPVNQIDWADSSQSYVRLILVPQGSPSISGPSVLPPLGFFVGERSPAITQARGSITQGGSTITDSTADYVADQLVGSLLSIESDDGTVIESYIVLGNTTNVITAGRFNSLGVPTLASFASSNGTYRYSVRTPILLGEAGMPFSRVYVGEDIRLAYGSSGGSQVRYIKWGFGSPEGVVTANIGSMYLRFDGSTSTTLYIKTANNGSATGWTAK